MGKKTFLLHALILILIAPYNGQGQWGEKIISPEVHADRTVTFRLPAPAADSVSIWVEFHEGLQPLTQDSDGIWSITLGPFAPGIYEYYFTIGGAKFIDPNSPHVTTSLRPFTSMVDIPGDVPMPYEERQAPHGAVTGHRYRSRALDADRGFYIYTPPGYSQAARQVRYPVLYLLHGRGDTERTWVTVGRANMILDNLIADGRARPMIIVMPHGHTPPAEGISNNARFEQDLLRDVIPFVEEHYRVAGGSKNRAIAGLSMGGGQALAIGLRHLDMFNYLCAFSSAVPADFDENYGDYLKSANEQLDLFWIGCGEDDFLLERNEQLTIFLKSKGVRHVDHRSKGGHEWSTWRGYLQQVLPMLFQ